MNPVASTTSSGAPMDQSTPSQLASPTIDKNMFLQLLVAQLKNQDPLNPSDSTQFVGQLAQFQQLENTLNMSQDISAMRQDMDTLTAALAPTTSTDSQS